MLADENDKYAEIVWAIPAWNEKTTNIFHILHVCFSCTFGEMNCLAMLAIVFNTVVTTNSSFHYNVFSHNSFYLFAISSLFVWVFVISLQKFNVKNVCQHGISNLSDLLTVSVSYVLSGGGGAGDGNDDVTDQTLNIVVKLLPHDPFGRYFVTINQFDLREIQFYTKVCIV